MKNIEGINISISRYYCNKTQKQENGDIHTIDASKQYQIFELQMNKTYFQSKQETIVDDIIRDLEGLINELKVLKQKDKQKESSEEQR